MRGLKLLFSRYKKHWVILLCMSVFFVGMMSAVIIFHADYMDPESDEADYIMCKLMALMPAMLAVALPSIFMAQEMQSSRFMRSIPGADRMFMTGVPVLSVAVTFAWTAATNAVYAAFILISGKEVVNITDMLIMGGILGLVFSVVPCCMMTLRFGSLTFLIYYLPFILIFVCFSRTRYGFGLPVWAGLATFFAGFAAAFGIDLIITRLAYKKGNFREPTYTQGRMS